MNAGEIAVASAALDDVFSDDIVVPAADGYPLARRCSCRAARGATPS